MAPDISSVVGGLKQLAVGGQLQLKVDDQTMVALRNTCNDLVSWLLTLQPHVADLSSIKKPYAYRANRTLDSAEALSVKHKAAGDKQLDVVKEYHDVVRNLSDAFVEARRQYSIAEHDNAAGFSLAALDKLPPITDQKIPDVVIAPAAAYSRITSAPSSTHLATESKPDGFTVENNMGNVEATPVPDASSQLQQVIQRNNPSLGTSAGNAPVKITAGNGEVPKNSVVGENPDSLTYDDLYNIGQTIDFETPRYIGSVWRWMAARTQEAVTNFGNTINALITEDNWSGAAAPAAKAAAAAIADQMQQWHQAMVQNGDNLTYTADWLELTKTSMPTGPDLSGQKISQNRTLYTGHGTLTVPQNLVYPDQTPIYRRNFQHTYLVGLPQSDSSIATPSSPSSTVSSDPAGDGKTDPKIGPTDGGGGALTGGSPAPMRSVSMPLASAAMLPQGQQLAQLQAAQTGDATAAQQAANQQLQDQLTKDQQAAQASAQQSADQQGLGQLGQLASLAQQGADGLRNAQSPTLQPASAQLAGAPDMPGLDSMAGGGGGIAGGAGGFGASGLPLSKDEGLASSSRLFPRASAALESAVGGAVLGRGGVAAGIMQSGAPGAAGSPGAGAGGQGQGQQKEYKRPKYRNSTEHLDEALGESPMAVRPVVEK